MSEQAPELTVRDIGIIGGNKIKASKGDNYSEFYSEIGKKGQESQRQALGEEGYRQKRRAMGALGGSSLAKNNPDHFSKMGAKGIESLKKELGEEGFRQRLKEIGAIGGRKRALNIAARKQTALEDPLTEPRIS
jgi:hypothetical protein